MMNIAIGSDHGGFLLKEEIKKHLEASGHAVFDEGCFSEESVDYPVYAQKVANLVNSQKATFGVLCCGTGIGISIASNKIDGIRSFVASSETQAKLAREHNDANIICLGGRTTEIDEAKKFVDIFLNTNFSAGRHEKRVNMIKKLEEDGVLDG